jgi:hypothetical protein
MLAFDPFYRSFYPSHFWRALPTVARLFVVFLCPASIYVLVALTRVLLRLHTLRRFPLSKSALVDLQNRLANLRQLVLFTFFLFGINFAMQLVDAYILNGVYSLPPYVVIVEEFRYRIEYAADVLFVLLVLHSLQWFVSARVQAFALKRELL